MPRSLASFTVLVRIAFRVQPVLPKSLSFSLFLCDKSPKIQMGRLYGYYGCLAKRQIANKVLSLCSRGTESTLYSDIITFPSLSLSLPDLTKKNGKSLAFDTHGLFSRAISVPRTHVFGMGDEVTRRPAWIWDIRIRGEGREAKEWSHLPGRQSRILKRVPFPDFSNKISFLSKTTFFCV